MNRYTVRYAHLEIPSLLVEGDLVMGSDTIGKMGNTGSCTANHLHIDVVEGFINKIIRLSEIGYDKEYIPNLKQLNYFIDKNLFDFEILITTYFGDPTYSSPYIHHGYDVVPENRHYEPGRNSLIYWNRSKTGIVLKAGHDNGYGNYVLIGFEA